MSTTETYSMPTFTKRGVDLFQEMGPDAYQCVEEEERLEERLRVLLLAPSKWQRVIHGSSYDFRFRVLRGLLSNGLDAKAEKFALCGRGDYVLRDAKGGLKVVPRRCNSRLCVRCARARGWKFAQRVMENLRGREHGFISHVVLTQRVHPGESLTKARARLRVKWLAMGQKRGIGYAGGLLVEHVKWSERCSGWHPHLHFIVETAGLDEIADLVARWRVAVATDEGWDVEKARRGEVGNTQYVRTVAGPGDALVLDGAEQGSFWSESKDGVTQALQYVVRDITEGPDREGFSALSDVEFASLMKALEGARLHTLLGDWRGKKDPEEEADEECEKEDSAKGMASPDAGSVALGTVDDVIKNVEARSHFAAWLLDMAGGNKSPLAVRARCLARELLGMEAV